MNGTYITHTPYYTMDFPLQAQTALDAYFRRGEALPRDAVTQLVPLWRARGEGMPFKDWVSALAPRERVFVPRMPR